MTKEELKQYIVAKHKKTLKSVKAEKAVKSEKEKKSVTAELRTKLAERRKVIASANKLADRLAAKLDSRMEKILLDAEELVKGYFPARYVSASLTSLQKKLIANGISCTFDKSIAKEAIEKTASSDITSDECKEAIDKIAEAVVGETEDTLEACDKAIENLAKKHFANNIVSTTRTMRQSVAAKMKETGLNFKF